MVARTPLRIAFFGVISCLSSVACFAAKPSDKAGIQFFEKKIRPVLVQHCYECHSEKSKIVKANLLLDTREGWMRGGDSGAAIIPGEGEKSLLVEALRQQGLEMPPKGKLSDEVIEDFVKWIEMGAPDPRDGKAPALKVVDVEKGREFWSFQPPKLTPPTATRNKKWARSEIDRYILAGIEAKGLTPVADADREMLIRRLSFDLIGLPPTPEEVRAFVEDHSSKAVEKLVDRLLDSPRFGERWGRHWLDVVRYAESSGKERNVPYRMAWLYRDYVIDAFNADMPFDQFIREQIAGDLLPYNSTEQRDRQQIASAFLAIGPRALTERVMDQFLLDVADEQLDTTCRAFLASTAGCARCHDHKFDPIPTTDYYALIGIFRNTESLAGVVPLRREFSYSQAAPLGNDVQRSELAPKLQQEVLRLEREGDKARNLGREGNKKKDPEIQKQAKAQEAEVNRQLNALRAIAEGFGESNSTQDRSGAKRAQFTMAVRDREKLSDFAVRIRGELEDLGPVVPRGFLSVATNKHTPKIDPKHSGRLELADWIGSRYNPLTARVYVNRLWQKLFGKGIVESLDNFGVVGDRPSHPELLDYLAIQFVENGWSTKKAIRAMVLSRTYQLSNQRTEIGYTTDPDNRLLWRFGRRRLEAEPIRDAILAVSGQLELGRPYGSPTLKLTNIELNSAARTMATDDSFRCRGVYLPMLRGGVPEMLGLFDMADPSLVIGQREVTTVATQALYMMNSKFVMEQAQRFAARLLDEEDLDDVERVDLAYCMALTRAPTTAERKQALDYIQQTNDGFRGKADKVKLDAWSCFCQTLFASAEFLYVR